LPVSQPFKEVVIEGLAGLDFHGGGRLAVVDDEVDFVVVRIPVKIKMRLLSGVLCNVKIQNAICINFIMQSKKRKNYLKKDRKSRINNSRFIST
jgi:hypothetical protein